MSSMLMFCVTGAYAVQTLHFLWFAASAQVAVDAVTQVEQLMI